MSKIQNNSENGQNDFRNFEFTNILKRLNLLLLNKSGLQYLEVILNQFEDELDFVYSELYLDSIEVKSLFSFNYKNKFSENVIIDIKNIFQNAENPIQSIKSMINSDNTILMNESDKNSGKIFILIISLINKNSFSFITKIFDIYFPAIKHNIELIDFSETNNTSNTISDSCFDLNKVLSDKSPTGILQLDKEMRIVYKNSALKTMMNDPIEDNSFIGKNIFDLESIKNAGLLPLMEKIQSGEIISDYKVQFNSIYGRSLFISLHSIPLYNTSNQFNGSLISVTDITEEIRYKNALEYSESKFRTIIDSAEEVIFIHNFETGEIEEVNQAFCKMYGYTIDEIPLLNQIRKSISDDEYSFQQSLNKIRLLNNQEHIQFEWLAKKKNGERFWVEVSLKKVILGKDIKVVSIVRDISENKLFLKDLDDSRARYKALFETAGDAILLIQDDKIIECNRQTLEIFKCSNEEIIGFSPMELSPDIQKNGELSLNMGRQHIETALSNGTQTFEWQHISFEGEVFIVEITLSVIDKQKRILIAILRDIAERNQYLSQLVYEKTFSDALINSMPAIFFIYNAEGKLIKWNINMEIFTGYNAIELNNFYILDWYEGYSKDRVIEEFPKLYSETKNLSMILNTLMKSGETVPYLYTITSFERDGIKYLIGTGIDISEWKYIEDAYVESEEKYKNLVDNAVEGIIIIQDNIIKFANPISESILGYETSMLFDTEISNYLFESDKYLFLNKADNSDLFKDSTIFRIRTIDNSIKWIECKSININWLSNPATLLFLSDITTRKIAEQALSQSENALKTFINALPGPAFLIGTDRKIIVANNALAIRYNNDINNLIGTDVFSYLDDTLRNIRISQLNTCIETRQTIIAEDLRNEKYYVDHFYPIINSENEVYNVAMVSIDISDLKYIEQQLVLSEERYRNLFENANEAIIVIQKSKIVLMNNKANEIISGNRFDIINHSFFELVHPEDRDLLISINNQRQNGETLDKRYRFRIVNDNDIILWLESSTVLIEFEGQPATLSFLNDITKQISAEKQIYLQNKAMDSAIYAIALFNLEGNITYINDAFTVLFGFTDKNELLNSSIYNYEHYFSITSIIKIAINEGKAFGEVSVKKNVSEIIWVQYSISLVKDLSSEPIQIMASFVDVTQRKNAQAELGKLNLELEEKVIERTSELNETLQKLETSNYELIQLNEELASGSRTLLMLNQKLSESQNELKIANDTKDKFISILAHDLKNPLQSIIMVSEILKRFGGSLDNDNAKTKILQIYDTALKINDLLNNLLTWSKSQSGRIDFKPESIRINELFEKSIKLFQGLAQQKQIKISNSIDSMFELFIDKNLIDTVIRNLISNAIKFTNIEGSIDILHFKENNYHNFSIKDNGIGISDEDQNKLFRIDISYSTIGTSKEKGTGLGLLLCKEFIDKHRGKIIVNSQLGEGTEFIFSLPINISE